MRKRIFVCMGVFVVMWLIFTAGRMFPFRMGGCISLDPMLGLFPRGGCTYIDAGFSSRECDMVVLGKPLQWTLSTDTLKQTPSWTNRDTQPPPLSVDKAIAISRQEVPKYFTNAVDWAVREITVETLGQQDKWYYLVGWLPPEANGDRLEIPVLMSGVALPLTANKRISEFQPPPARDGVPPAHEE
jgi:hypothetical protein